jgi:hypothetical protein
VLVSAYDALSQPDMTQADTAKPKTKTINRSNEGWAPALLCASVSICERVNARELVSAFLSPRRRQMTAHHASSPCSSDAPTERCATNRCHRTPVHCPRCQAPWGEAIDGLEAAAYSHLMTGIKCYCCR